MTMELIAFTEAVDVLAKIDPASHTTAQTSSWVTLDKTDRAVAVAVVGAIASTGTLDMKLRQAKDASGTDAKDITGKAITQVTQAGGGSNKIYAIEVRGIELDTENGFSHVAVVLTPAVAATIAGVLLLGTAARHEPVAGALWSQAVK